MTFFQQLQQATQQERQQLLSAPIITHAVQQGIPLASYTAFLEQAYHHVKHTVPLLMACGARLPDRLGWLREAIVDYIAEEFGHEEWVLNDLTACGVDADRVRHGQPALATELMVSYVYDRIARHNPVSFFGMVLVLEGTSTQVATQAADRIQQQLHLPNSAFSYLTSHGSLDISHMQGFELLMNQLTEPEDQQAVIHTARVVYRLYGDMFRSLPLPQEVAA